MTLTQAEILAAYTGLVILVRDDMQEYEKFVQSLLNGEPKENASETLSKRAKEEFDKKYQSFSKNELAVIEIYTGISLLAEEDKPLLEQFGKYSEHQIKHSFMRLCLPKKIKKVTYKKETEKTTGKGKKIAEYAVIGVAALILIGLLLFVLLFIFGDSENTDIYLGMSLTLIIALFAVVALYLLIF